MEQKKYVVWYRAGAGGFLVSWLIQVALDPTSLDDALEVFPLSLIDQHGRWKMHERTPPDVGLLCNLFHPNAYYDIDTVASTRDLLDAMMHRKHPKINDLLAARIKFYLINFVYRSGHIRLAEYHKVKKDPVAYRLHDQDHVRQMTDILFEPDRNIFVIAPEPYLEMASKIKNCRYYKSLVDQTLLDYPDIKIFHFEKVWQKGYIEELERLLGISLDDEQRLAGDRLVERYMSVMPKKMREWCDEN